MTSATAEKLSDIQEKKVSVGDLEIHVNELGDGPPLVVIHRSTGPMWSPFYDQLAQSFSVIAPDVPGYGQSTRPATARSQRDLAILLNQLLDTLSLDKIHLVGLGFGGFLAAEMATMHQGRLASLTLVGASGIRPKQGEIHDPIAESWVSYQQQSFRSEEAFEEFFGETPHKDILTLWDYSREMTSRIMWKPWMWSLSLPQSLQAVRTPTLVVWGRHDQIVPLVCGEQYVECLQNAKLEVVEEAGHVVDLEQPEQLTQLIQKFTASA